MPREYPRKLRLNAQFQEELATLIRDELRDPRVAGVTVTAVDVAPDLRNATVRVSMLGADAQLSLAVEGLTHAAGKLRHALGRRLQLRLVPQLRFIADTALREGDRIGALIKAAVADDQQHASGRKDD
jgi:ribosome-binding factor A